MDDTFQLLEVDDESSPHAFLLTGVPAAANASLTSSTGVVAKAGANASASAPAATLTAASAANAATNGTMSVAAGRARERDVIESIAKGGLLDSERLVKLTSERLADAPNGLGDRVQLFYTRFPLERGQIA